MFRLWGYIFLALCALIAIILALINGDDNTIFQWILFGINVLLFPYWLAESIKAIKELK